MLLFLRDILRNEKLTQLSSVFSVLFSNNDYLFIFDDNLVIILVAILA